MSALVAGSYNVVLNNVRRSMLCLAGIGLVAVRQRCRYMPADSFIMLVAAQY
jgi:hypothetical protein